MPDSDFKLCPYCRERIRGSAIKCRYCGEWLEKPVKPPLPGRIEDSAVPNHKGKADQICESQAEAPICSQVEQGPDSADQVALPSPLHAALAMPQPEHLIQNEKPAAKSCNYFIRHWRGDLSLGVSYWVNCFLVNVAYIAAISAMAEMVVVLYPYFSPWSVVAFVTGIFLFSIFLIFWQCVGTWRSAQKHPARGGSRTLAVLAKIIMVVSVGAFLNSLTTVWIPLAENIHKAFSFNNTLPACAIRVLLGGKAVEITGGLSIGSADKLEAVLKATPHATVVYVNSIGGWAREGQKAWHFIRQRGLSTYTDGCASAATLIFLAGKERTIGDGAKIGFHAGADFGFWEGEKPFDDNKVRETMKNSGVSEDFINRVLATPNGEMWYPSVEEMRRARVITKEDAPLKTFASTLLTLMETPTNSESLLPVKTGHDEIDTVTRFAVDFFADWRNLFTEMNSNLQNSGDPDIYSDGMLTNEPEIRKGIAIQLKRMAIIESYHSRAQQEIGRVNRNFAAMSFSDAEAKGILIGMTNSFDKIVLQIEDLFTLRLKVEADKGRFLEFMAQEFSNYKVQSDKIAFENQADSDKYEALTKSISESRTPDIESTRTV